MILWIQAWKSKGEFFKQWTWNPDTKAPDPSLPPRLSLSYVELSMQMEPHTNTSLNLCSSPVARGKCWQCTFLQTTHFILIISVFVEWCNISWLCHQVVEGMVDDVSPRPMPNCRLLQTTFWDQKNPKQLWFSESWLCFQHLCRDHMWVFCSNPLLFFQQLFRHEKLLFYKDIVAFPPKTADKK